MSRLYKNKDKGSAKMISDLFFCACVCVAKSDKITQGA